MQSNFSCLAIDMGAGSIRIVKALVGDDISLEECHRFENQLVADNASSLWDLGYIEAELEKGLQKVLDESKIPIRSVGVDSWGVDYVLLNKLGVPLGNPVSYRDGRTKGMKERWNQMMGSLETFRRTGINYNIFNTLYQLLSSEGGEELRNTARILFIADYINYYLSGVAANEQTLASTSQMLSCSEATWDTRILEHLGISPDLLSPLVASGTLLGKLKPKYKCSVAPDLVAVAGHDTACAVAAIPFESSNAAFLATGTWCVLGTLNDVPFLSEAAFQAGITNERSADGGFRPLKNLMGLWLIQQLRKAFGNRHTYAEIDQMAAELPVSEVLIDPSDESFFHPENMQQAFDAFLVTEGHGPFREEAFYYRCAYDSLVASFRMNLLLFEQLRGKAFREIHVIGGGVQSTFFCQLMANAFQRRLIAGPVEGAVYGNIMLQLKALGKLDDALRTKLHKSMELNIYEPEKAR